MRTELLATGDAFAGNLVNEITSSPLWQSGNNAIVITCDEGNNANQTVATIVITNHGPRGVKDSTNYDHYSLLASLEDAFGLGCLQNACTATPMTPLFQVTGSTTVPVLPPPFTPPPNGDNSISPMGTPVKGSKTSLNCASGWQRVPSPSIGSLDNNLAAVPAASPSDAWAVGDYYDASNPSVLVNMAEHWNGATWSEYPLPNVGANQNTLFADSDLPAGSTWAVGYYLDANWAEPDPGRALERHRMDGHPERQPRCAGKHPVRRRRSLRHQRLGPSACKRTPAATPTPSLSTGTGQPGPWCPPPIQAATETPCTRWTPSPPAACTRQARPGPRSPARRSSSTGTAPSGRSSARPLIPPRA